MKKINKILYSKFTKLVAIPTLLLVCGIIASLIFNNRISFSVLEYSHANVFNSLPEGRKLLQGDVVIGQFTAKENHLGIVSVKFEDFVKPDFRGEDVLQFRIKEKGEKNWHYLNNYRSGLLEDQLIYPFGFPTIAHSKDKTYVFELESLLGNESNAVQLNNNKILSAHQIPREFIVGGKMNFVNFLTKKFITSFSSTPFLLSSVIYFLPFLFYVVWLLVLLKFSFKKNILSVISIMLILINILLVREYYLGVYLALLSLWIISLKVFKLHSSVSFVIFISLFIIWIFFNSFGYRIFDSNLNIWAYTFLIVGTVQLVFEYRKPNKKRLMIREFIKGLIRFK